MINHKSTLEKSNNKLSWFKKVIDPYLQSFSPSFSKIIHGQKEFVLGLKCFRENEYNADIFPNQRFNSFESPVYACKFGESEEQSSKLGLAYEDGRIIIQETDGPNEGNCLIEKTVHQNAIYDFVWIPKKNDILTASADLSISLISAENLNVKSTFKGHSKSVKTININKWDTNVFASGGRDCNVVIWDLRCHPNNKANEIFGAHTITKSSLASPGYSRSCAIQIQNSVIGLLFNQQYTLISAGASDGFIKMWDLRKTYSRSKREPHPLYTLEYAGSSSCCGYISMQMSPYGERIYVSCLDGKIYAYHLVNPILKPVAEYYGHMPNTYYAKFCISPCGSYLLSGSSNDQAYIWLTSCPGVPIAFLAGHLDEVTCVAWNARNTVVTCSDDMTHRFFKYQNMDQIELEDLKTKQNLRGFSIPFSQGFTRDTRASSMSDAESDIQTKLLGSKGLLNNGVSSPKNYLSHSLLLSTSPIQGQTRTPPTNEQVTPKFSGTKTLLSWLSSSKTPKEQSAPRTPNNERKDAGRMNSKRKLADFLENGQENLRNENKKPVLSPSKDVLGERPSNLGENLNSVSKMLAYPNSNSPSKHTIIFKCSRNENIAKSIKQVDKSAIELEEFICDSITFDETSLLPFTLSSNIHKSLEMQLLSQDMLKSPKQPFGLDSPTANLPNFVVDGRSPHNSQESLPITKLRQTDWLTCLSQKHNTNTRSRSLVKTKVRVTPKRQRPITVKK